MNISTLAKFCTCAACHDIIRRPLLITTCQHSFCLKCILPTLEGKPIDETKCPRCDDNNITPENIIPSKYIQNMLVELASQTNKQDHCSEIMSPSMTPSEITLSDIFSLTPSDEIPRDIEDAALHVIRHKIKNSNNPNKSIEFKSGGPRVRVYIKYISSINTIKTKAKIFYISFV